MDSDFFQAITENHVGFSLFFVISGIYHEARVVALKHL